MDRPRRMLGSVPRGEDIDAAVSAYLDLFPAVYVRLHRRDGKRRSLSGASRAVLMHLAQSGPLTVGQCARHLERAQSVVSELVDQLERHGLLARVQDERDRRRTLVWLSAEGRRRLEEEQQVLSRELLSRALANMAPGERKELLRATAALVAAADAALVGDGSSGTPERRSGR